MSYFEYNGKQVYYTIVGNGKPTMFLHGDAVSSQLFVPMLPLYTNRLQVILIDFLGCGKSDRIHKFPMNKWQDWGKQALALTEHLRLGKVNLVGTSGGAWSAMNAALEKPELIDKVVADSFDGRTLHDGFVEELLVERQEAKSNGLSRGFYQWCLGSDWETIVDIDTDELVQLATSGVPLFSKPLSTFKPPLLFMGSKEDTTVGDDLKAEYLAMVEEIGHGEICMFPSGEHPAMGTNPVDAAETIIKFLNNQNN